MKKPIKDLALYILDGRPEWGGVIMLGREKAEVQIEAPSAGPSTHQLDILAELIASSAEHRSRIFTAVSTMLQGRGVPASKIHPGRMSVSIIRVGSSDSRPQVLMVVDMKLTGFFARSYSCQVEMLQSGDFSASVIE